MVSIVLVRPVVSARKLSLILACQGSPNTLFGECARSPKVYLHAIILAYVLLHQPGGLFSSHTNVRAGHGLQFPASMPLLMVFPTVGRSLFLLPPNHRLSKTISFLQSSVQIPHPPKSLQEALSPRSLWGAWTRALRTPCETWQPRQWSLFPAVKPAPCGAQMAPCFLLTPLITVLSGWKGISSTANTNGPETGVTNNMSLISIGQGAHK